MGIVHYTGRPGLRTLRRGQYYGKNAKWKQYPFNGGYTPGIFVSQDPVAIDPVGAGNLGVHGHWNNPVDRKYSRNLGKKEGIELIQILH